MSTQIERATSLAEAAGWTVSKIGNLALFERGDAAIESRFGLSTGQILDASIAQKGEGVRTLISAHHKTKLTTLSEYLLTDWDS